MNLPVVFDPRADQDLDEIVDWLQQSSLTPDKFLTQLRQALKTISAMPELHAVVFADFRRARVGRTNYYLYYRIREQLVVVLAVVHGRRDPAVWQSRV